MHLGIKVSRPDPGQHQWLLESLNAELAGIGPALLTASARSPYPIIAPRSGTATWDAQATTDLATRIAAKQPKGEDNATFGRHLFEVLIGAQMLAVIHQHGALETITLHCDDDDFNRCPHKISTTTDEPSRSTARADQRQGPYLLIPIARSNASTWPYASCCH